LAEIKAHTDAGLLGPVPAYVELNPGTPYGKAFERVVAARMESAEVDAEVVARGAPAPSSGGSAPPPLALTATDLAGIVSVNEARASVGLPPDPGADGLLTVAQYQAKYAATVAAAANALAGDVATEVV